MLPHDKYNLLDCLNKKKVFSRAQINDHNNKNPLKKNRNLHLTTSFSPTSSSSNNEQHKPRHRFTFSKEQQQQQDEQENKQQLHSNHNHNHNHNHYQYDNHFHQSPSQQHKNIPQTSRQYNRKTNKYNNPNPNPNDNYLNNQPQQQDIVQTQNYFKQPSSKVSVIDSSTSSIKKINLYHQLKNKSFITNNSSLSKSNHHHNVHNNSHINQSINSSSFLITKTREKSSSQSPSSSKVINKRFLKATTSSGGNNKSKVKRYKNNNKNDQISYQNNFVVVSKNTPSQQYFKRSTDESQMQEFDQNQCILKFKNSLRSRQSDGHVVVVGNDGVGVNKSTTNVEKCYDSSIKHQPYHQQHPTSYQNQQPQTPKNIHLKDIRNALLVQSRVEKIRKQDKHINPNNNNKYSTFQQQQQSIRAPKTARNTLLNTPQRQQRTNESNSSSSRHIITTQKHNSHLLNSTHHHHRYNYYSPSGDGNSQIQQTTQKLKGYNSVMSSPYSMMMKQQKISNKSKRHRNIQKSNYKQDNNNNSNKQSKRFYKRTTKQSPFTSLHNKPTTPTPTPTTTNQQPLSKLTVSVGVGVDNNSLQKISPSNQVDNISPSTFYPISHMKSPPITNIIEFNLPTMNVSSKNLISSPTRKKQKISFQTDNLFIAAQNSLNVSRLSRSSFVYQQQEQFKQQQHQQQHQQQSLSLTKQQKRLLDPIKFQTCKIQTKVFLEQMILKIKTQIQSTCKMSEKINNQWNSLFHTHLSQIQTKLIKLVKDSIKQLQNGFAYYKKNILSKHHLKCQDIDRDLLQRKYQLENLSTKLQSMYNQLSISNSINSYSNSQRQQHQQQQHHHQNHQQQQQIYYQSPSPPMWRVIAGQIISQNLQEEVINKLQENVQRLQYINSKLNYENVFENYYKQHFQKDTNINAKQIFNVQASSSLLSNDKRFGSKKKQRKLSNISQTFNENTTKNTIEKQNSSLSILKQQKTFHQVITNLQNSLFQGIYYNMILLK